ncbi:MAG TPA: NAD-dependent epimerase/dehydratase family protein, partial [Leptolinea sp.]
MALALISGGSGLIGTALSRLLLQHGHQVVVLTRDPLKRPSYGESAVWDGIHPELWMAWVEKADWIINLAGENIGAQPWKPERLRQISESRVFAGELLSEAVLRAPHRPSAFLQMSAIGYYGPQDENDEEALDEHCPSGQDRLAAICREWEGSSVKVENLRVRRLIVRTGLVL